AFSHPGRLRRRIDRRPGDHPAAAGDREQRRPPVRTGRGHQQQLLRRNRRHHRRRPAHRRVRRCRPRPADPRRLVRSPATEGTMTRQSDVEEPAYEPDPAAIAADLADDGVHVDPALTDAIAAGQLDDITSLVADAEHQVFVLAVPLGYDSDVSANQLVTLVHRELPEDGVYFVTAGTPQTSWRTESTTYGVSTDNENSLAALVARDRYPSDLGKQLVETLEIFTGGDARQVYEEYFPE